MKIIDNKKDYYDYLSGIYGIDDLIVYDRRGSKVLTNDAPSTEGLDEYFCQCILPDDQPMTAKRKWSLESISRHIEASAHKHSYSKTWQEGRVFHYILEVGRTHYFFEVERWLDTNHCLHMEYRLVDTKRDVAKRFSDAPICIIPCHVWTGWMNDARWEEEKRVPFKRVENPILANTYIPGLIPPIEIWRDIYNYLSSLRDKPFTDSRTDTQKLESAGFDKVISFRNRK